jgi:surface antigen
MRMSMKVSQFVIATVAAALVVPAMAQPRGRPPAHAPAHGLRAQQQQQEIRLVSLSGNEWELDYGVRSGNCDRRKIATALGGLTGALIANRVAEDDNRTVATLIGAAAGAFIGNRIGRNIDKADEACIGHALELGEAGQPVNWSNEETGVSYQVVPGATRTRDGAHCREFTFTAVADSERSSRQGLGCESDAGVWQIVE